MPLTLFITGTGTDVGKTVLTCLLIRQLQVRAQAVAGFKPVSSGGRSDALAIQSALGAGIPLEIVNPIWFSPPVTPLVAARMAGTRIELTTLTAHVRLHQAESEVCLVEGAGGLLSPLGERFSSRDLLVALDAVPVVVAVNRLGVLNDVFLTWEALPAAARARARLVLFETAQPDASADSNPGLLAEHLGPDRMFRLPWLPEADRTEPQGAVAEALDDLCDSLGLSDDRR